MRQLKVYSVATTTVASAEVYCCVAANQRDPVVATWWLPGLPVVTAVAIMTATTRDYRLPTRRHSHLLFTHTHTVGSLLSVSCLPKKKKKKKSTLTHTYTHTDKQTDKTVPATTTIFSKANECRAKRKEKKRKGKRLQELETIRIIKLIGEKEKSLLNKEEHRNRRRCKGRRKEGEW